MELIESLTDTSRPTFLFGSTPPREGTSEEKARVSCAKFVARSATLATDGYIVYDIQEEKGRTESERPFPFRKTLDPSWYASLFHEHSAKHCIVYKSVVEDSMDNLNCWIDKAIQTHGHRAFNLVGAPTSKREYKGPTIQEAMDHVKSRNDCFFGCVSIPERHTKKGNEQHNMMKKINSGAQWFITQGIFDATAVIQLLHDYGAVCKEQGKVPRKVCLTFAPCGRVKTMTFIKWLGMNVPEAVHDRIMNAENPVEESIKVSVELLQYILEQTASCGVPIGISVESLSIFKEEIDAAHIMFTKLQATMLNHRGSPWSVKWYCVPSTLRNSSLENLALPITLSKTRSFGHVAGSVHQTPLNPPSPATLSEKSGSNLSKLDLFSIEGLLLVTLVTLGGVFVGRTLSK